jgi:hypothetical protein
MNARDYSFVLTESSTGNSPAPSFGHIRLMSPDVRGALNRPILPLHQRIRGGEMYSTNAATPRVVVAFRNTRAQVAAEREATIRKMLELRALAIAKGMRLKTVDEINEEVGRMRDREDD